MQSPRNLAPVFITALLLSLPAALASAQVEITPTFGYRSGSTDFITPIVCIAIVGPCPNLASVDDGDVLGLVIDVPLNDRWLFEGLVNRQQVDLTLDLFGFINIDPAANSVDLTISPFGELEISTAHVGVQRRWRLARAEPYLAVGAGISRLETTSDSFFILDFDEDQFSASLAGGLIAPLTDLLALRFEARGYWIGLPDELATDDLRQIEASTGLAFRF